MSFHPFTPKPLAALAMLVALGLFAGMPPAHAQQTTPPNQDQAQSQNQAATPVTATGCLQSPNSNVYSLTDQSSDTTYTLTSSSVDLSTHVGHTVTVTGTPVAPSANNGTADSSSTAADQAPAATEPLGVSSLTMVSTTCDSASATAAGTTATAAATPDNDADDTTATPAAAPNDGTAAQAATPATTPAADAATPQESDNGAATATPAAADSGTAQAGANSLPKTAGDLPLLSLLGLLVSGAGLGMLLLVKRLA